MQKSSKLRDHTIEMCVSLSYGKTHMKMSASTESLTHPLSNVKVQVCISDTCSNCWGNASADRSKSFPVCCVRASCIPCTVILSSLWVFFWACQMLAVSWCWCSMCRLGVKGRMFRLGFLTCSGKSTMHTRNQHKTISLLDMIFV